MRAREPLVVAGLALAETAFGELAPQVSITRVLPDGQPAKAGQTLLEVAGPARALLGAERVALNFLQRLSGVATLTARFVQAVQGTRRQILDTRKTTPGWRRLRNHGDLRRRAQSSPRPLRHGVLIKDNHLAALRHEQPNAIAAAVQRARAAYPRLKVEVEADTLEQVDQALAAGADIILLDNMDPAQLRQAVRQCAGRVPTEASGGVNLDTVSAIAQTGVDFISVGALTHSARAVDIGLDFESVHDD